MPSARSARVTLVVVLLSIAHAQHQTCADDVDALGHEANVLLQTYSLVNARSQRKALPSDWQSSTLQGLLAAIGHDKSSLHATASSASAPALHKKVAASKPNDDCVAQMPIDLRLLYHSLRFAGQTPSAESCDPNAPMFGMMDILLAEVSSSSHDDDSDRAKADWYFILLPVGYFLVVAVCLLSMLWNLLFPTSPTKSASRRSETASWVRGCMNWLSVGWVDGLIAKWGNLVDSDVAKISSEDVDDVGDTQDDAQICYEKLNMMWEAEIEAVGVKQASMSDVIIRFVGWHRILVTMFCFAIFHTCMLLGPPVAMAWVLRYIEWLYIARLKEEVIPWRSLFPPTLVAIVLFQGFPACMAATNSVSNMLAMRISCRIRSALTLLVFQKAQRLPLVVPDTEDQQKHLQQSAEAEKNGVEEQNEEQSLNWDFEAKAPSKFNLVQLVGNDINANLATSPVELCRIIVVIPICTLLLGWLWLNVHDSILVCVAMSSTIVVLALGLAAKSQIGWVVSFINHAGNRFIFIENLLFNIRTAKMLGWEGVMEKKNTQLRTTELAMLWAWHKRLGIFVLILHQFPMILIVTCLWGSAWLYHTTRMTDIFVTLPIIYTLFSAFVYVMATLPNAVKAKPSLDRIEHFMKLPEAPFPRSESSDRAPTWVHIWPEANAHAHDSDVSQSIAAQTLQIQGSFKLHSLADPILKDLNLSIPFGSCVGVLGTVGAGKTSFLQAMMGELYPVGEAHIGIPAQVAYSGQVPHICEGTLKENILYGEPFEEDRYNKCLSAACLLPDLRVLPGGDEVPVGSRGISLSGGQRARVSMARAAYSAAQVMLIDDPFGAVDARTARHLLKEYLHGAVLKGRTKVVVCQPDPDRIQNFDRIVILHGGRIAEEGTPEEVMQTSSYRSLLNDHQTGALDRAAYGEALVVADVDEDSQIARTEAFHLRDVEGENRPDWKALKHFINLGGWWNLSLCIFFGWFVVGCNLMMGLVLRDWTTDSSLAKAGLLHTMPSPIAYLRQYCVWWAVSCVFIILCQGYGAQFAIKLSEHCNAQTMKSILHAPIDRFFDRTPVGRIMNRLVADLMAIDMFTLGRVLQIVTMVCVSAFPLVYLHILMPLYFTCASFLFYCIVFLFVKKFWNTMVPMRYLTHVSVSHSDAALTEIEYNNSFVRACRKGDFKFQQFQRSCHNVIKSDATTQTFLKQWIVNRLFLMMGFLVCAVVVVCIWVPNTIAIGAVGLCLVLLLVIVIDIEPNINNIMQAQFQMIAMQRVHDYCHLEQEADFEKDTDIPYTNYCITVERAKLGTLIPRNSEEGILIVRERNGKEQQVLEQTHQNTFAAPLGFELLDPSHPELKGFKRWHCLVAVNGKGSSELGCKSLADRGEIGAMVQELCSGTSSEVLLELKSVWLLSGAHLIIKDLRTGYGNITQNVLSHVSFDIQPRSKVGVVGPTGCGKSTLLLAILRVLEARGGQILLNGVDVKTLGLKTLRTVTGMVAQDPILMQSSVRENLDPFGQFGDDIIWKGLNMVRMKEHIEGLVGGLDYQFQGNDGCLSYGQRQLLCMARMVIRQPALILLDEATSALDPATQQQVQKTVEEHFPNSSILMVAHRLETIVNFDKVVVMDRGTIKEQGSPAELREVKDGVFAKMLAAKQIWQEMCPA